MYAGVDEAGRGPVLGPLVVAGVLGRVEDVPDGVDDSKVLAPERREQLAKRVLASENLTVVVRAIPAGEINERMREGESLNKLEADAFVRVLDELDADTAIVDTVGADVEAFGRTLTTALGERCNVEARSGADASDPLVGAASIVAKVQRDAAMSEIEATLDEQVGSGYPSDPTTRAFLESWRARSREPPGFARTAWATLEKIGFGTRRLDEFGGAGGPT